MPNDTQFSNGYQAALDDLARTLDEHGDTAVFQWIYDNAQKHETRVIVRHMAKY